MSARLLSTVAALAAMAALTACGQTTRTTDTSAGPVAPNPAPIQTEQLLGPMGSYETYVYRHLATLRPQLATLQQDLAANNASAAKRDWQKARISWLQIGQDDQQYGAFGNLGGAIDGLAAGLKGGAHSAAFTGFHRVEYDLYTSHNLHAAQADTAKLRSLVSQMTPQTVTKDLALTPKSLDTWVLRCHEILEDALRDSLSRNDDYGSHMELASVSADVTATREMLSVLGPLIQPRMPGLLSTAARQLRTIDARIKAAHGGTAARERLNASVSAALETLAPVSEVIQITNANT
ncbi:MAG: EfeM/EfeO family lipoprotein [Solirubrobacterales bacterium]|nr:EfeM/EfeO family lipoprotein [Solirubrobacterales bacterium]